MILSVFLGLTSAESSACGITPDTKPYVYVENIRSRLFLPSYIMIQNMLVSGEIISIDLAAKLMNARWHAMATQKRDKIHSGTLP